MKLDFNQDDVVVNFHIGFLAIVVGAYLVFGWTGAGAIITLYGALMIAVSVRGSMKLSDAKKAQEAANASS